MKSKAIKKLNELINEFDYDISKCDLLKVIELIKEDLEEAYSAKISPLMVAEMIWRMKNNGK